MKRHIFVFVAMILFIFSALLWSERVAVLKEINNPGFDLVVEKNRLYVPEGHRIYIYSLHDYRLIKTFGSKGEGPREFRGDISLSIQSDHLLVESSGKISYFSKRGEFIREKAYPRKGTLKGIVPIAGKYVGRGSSFSDPDTHIRYNTLSFYNTDLLEGERITKTPSRFQNDGSVMFMNGTFHFKVSKNYIFVQYHGREFKLDCFDQKGKLAFTIQDKNFKNRKVNAEDKVKAFAYIKKFMPWVYAQKQRIKFPAYWGGIGTFFIDQQDEKIYIITYVKKGRNESLMYVYDLQGTFIKKFFLPVGERNIWAPYPLDIEGGKMVQLRENLEKEQWELHISYIL